MFCWLVCLLRKNLKKHKQQRFEIVLFVCVLLVVLFFACKIKKHGKKQPFQIVLFVCVFVCICFLSVFVCVCFCVCCGGLFIVSFFVVLCFLIVVFVCLSDIADLMERQESERRRAYLYVLIRHTLRAISKQNNQQRSNKKQNEPKTTETNINISSTCFVVLK